MKTISHILEWVYYDEKLHGLVVKYEGDIPRILYCDKLEALEHLEFSNWPIPENLRE